MSNKNIKKAEVSHSKRMINMKQTKTIAATSPAAMGKALVLLATSCAALSSGPPIPVGRRGIVSQQQRSAAQHSVTKAGRFHQMNGGSNAPHSMVALHYRDGDEDQPLNMQAANINAVNSASTSATEQLVMDEYLEYVERRYSRMHPKHRPQQPTSSKNITRPRVVLDFDLPRKIFLSTLAFHRSPPSPLASLGQLRRLSRQAVVLSLKQPTVASTDSYDRAAAVSARHVPQEDEEEDPLNVLGLSSLASARLRQRLHVPREFRDEYMQLTTTSASAVNFINHYMHLSDHTPKASSPATSAATGATAATNEAEAVVNLGGRTSSYISLSFTVQFQLLLATLNRIASAFVHTIKIMTAFSSRMFSEILDKGGFGHSVRMMSVTSVAILFMFKPLFQGAFKQG